MQITLDLISEDKVQFNCSQIHYLDPISLLLTAEVQNYTVVCENGSEIVTIDHGSLKCGTPYILEVHWVSAQLGQPCVLYYNTEAKVPCSGK